MMKHINFYHIYKGLNLEMNSSMISPFTVMAVIQNWGFRKFFLLAEVKLCLVKEWQVNVLCHSSWFTMHIIHVYTQIIATFLQYLMEKTKQRCSIDKLIILQSTNIATSTPTAVDCKPALFQWHCLIQPRNYTFACLWSL